MKNIKILILFLFLSIATAAKAEEVVFNIPVNVKDLSLWRQVSSSISGVFNNNFYMSWAASDAGYNEGKDGILLANNSALKSNNPSLKRILDAENTNRFFRMSGSLTLENISLRQGTSGGGSFEGGGAIYMDGMDFTLNANNVTFELNRSTTSKGGALFLKSGILTIVGTVSFISNFSDRDSGGAIYADEGVKFLNGGDIVFTGNSALNGGGAVFTTDIDIFTNVFLSSNTSVQGNGGGFYATGNISIHDSAIDDIIVSTVNITISYNNAGNGGGIYADGKVEFSNSGNTLIIDNRSIGGSDSGIQNSGGGVYSGNDILFNSGLVILSSNAASDAGGALFSNRNIYFRTQTKIIGNFAAGDEGAAYSGGGALWALNDIYFSSSVIIASNSVQNSNGGAIYSESGTVEFGMASNPMISNNSTSLASSDTGNGGAIYAAAINMFAGGTFEGNTAEGNGGAIYIRSSVSASTNTSQMIAYYEDFVFTDNSAQDGKDIFINALSAAHKLVLFTSHSRTMTFDGGITAVANDDTAAETIIEFNAFDKTGTLNFNGDFNLVNFKTSNGVLNFGKDSTFNADREASFSNTFINIRNKNDQNELFMGSLNVSSATFYYDLNLDSKFVDGRSFPFIDNLSSPTYNLSDRIIISDSARLNNFTIKVGITGISSSAVFNLIMSTNNSTGNILIDRTNVEGKLMNRVKKYEVVYSSKNDYNEYIPADYSNWSKVDLEIEVEQLHNVEKLNKNELQIANLLDRVYGEATENLFDAIDTIDTMSTAGDKKNALSSLSAGIYANAITIPAFNNAKNNVFSRLSKNNFQIDDKNEYKRSAWGQGYASRNIYRKSDYSPKDFKADSKGALGGFDTLITDKQIFGFLFGTEYTDAEQNKDKVTVSGYSAGAYSSYYFENDYEIKIMAIGSKHDYSAVREVEILDYKETLSSDFSGLSINLSAEVSKNYDLKFFHLKPFIGTDFSYSYINAFNETGSKIFNVSLFDNEYIKSVGNIGAQLGNDYGEFHLYLRFQVDCVLSGRYGEFDGKVTGLNNENLGNIRIRGIENDMISGFAGIGFVFNLCEFAGIYGNVNTLFSQTQSAVYGNLGINIKFSTEIKDFYDKSE